jgi:hypothetical protein
LIHAGLSEITLEEGNKRNLLKMHHNRALYSHTWKCYIFIDHPERFRGQEGNVLSNNSAVE